MVGKVTQAYAAQTTLANTLIIKMISISVLICNQYFNLQHYHYSLQEVELLVSTKVHFRVYSTVKILQF